MSKTKLLIAAAAREIGTPERPLDPIVLRTAAKRRQLIERDDESRYVLDIKVV